MTYSIQAILLLSTAILLSRLADAQSVDQLPHAQDFPQVAQPGAENSLPAYRCLSLPEPHREQKRDAAKGHGNFLNTLKQKGVVFGADEFLEGYYNFMGGLRRGSAVVSTFDANISIDMKKFMHVPGGIFYADFEAHSFQNPTSSLVGDLQVFDKNTADPFLQMFEFWYQQKFLHNMLRLKIGKVDANAEFSLIDNGLDFETSSAHVTPTLFVFPTFPDPMPSVNLFFTPCKLFYASVAAYDANQMDHFLDFSGKPGAVQATLNGTLWLGETGLTWNHLSGKASDGNLRLGTWRHTGQFNRTDDNSPVQGAGGIYVVINQTLWKPIADKNSTRGFRMFLEYANSNKGVAPIYEHFGCGLLWTGMTENRPHDEIGICTQYGRVSSRPGLVWNYEQTIEGFYRFAFASWVNVQPDFQYIVHPGGKYENALTVTLQLNVKF